MLFKYMCSCFFNTVVYFQLKRITKCLFKLGPTLLHFGAVSGPSRMRSQKCTTEWGPTQLWRFEKGNHRPCGSPKISFNNKATPSVTFPITGSFPFPTRLLQERRPFAKVLPFVFITLCSGGDTGKLMMHVNYGTKYFNGYITQCGGLTQCVQRSIMWFNYPTLKRFLRSR